MTPPLRREFVGGGVSRLRLDANLAVLFTISALFVCRLVVALVLIPPWQHPEEPTHVAIAQVVRSRLLSLESSDPAREAEIFQSMAQYDWWAYYGVSTPAPIPARFMDAGETLGAGPTGSQLVPNTYYALVAGVLSLLPPLSVVDTLHVMRALSSLMAIATLWVAWRSARECLGETGGAIVTALLSLHPQFAVTSTAASSDAMVNLAGACLWWQAVRAVRRANCRGPLAIGWAAAIGGAISDRMGVPLVLSCSLVSVVAILRTGIRRSTFAFAASVLALMGAFFWFLNTFWRTFDQAQWTRVMPVPAALTWEFFGRFTSGVFESWWFSLGWARYALPSWWVATPALLAIAAVAGITRRLMRDDDARLRIDIGVMIMMLAVQVAAVYWVYFRLANGAQGRYLFPCLVPTLVLLWLGVEEWLPTRYRQHAAIGLVLVFALIDAALWTRVVIPAYTS